MSHSRSLAGAEFNARAEFDGGAWHEAQARGHGADRRPDVPPGPRESPVAKSIPNYLRLYNERPPAPAKTAEDAWPSLVHFCRAFERATGWPLRYLDGDAAHHALDLLWSAPVDPGVGTSPGHIGIEMVDDADGEHIGRVGSDAASELAAAVAQLLDELARTRHALRHREADLAVGVPLASPGNSPRRLADQLAAVLRAGTEAIGCHTAALYLLDEATSELKLRSCWNLPPERYTAPARPLRSATADLEALTGHAVVLDDAESSQAWNPPEPFAAAVCVPVASSTTPLGTLWIFSRHARPFSDQEVNVAEVVAGRLAGELEREVLLAEGTAGARLKRQWLVAERWQQNQIPRNAPLIDGWDVAGWTQGPDGFGGEFFDWFAMPDDALALAIGGAYADGLEAALAAAALRAALRSHAQYIAEPQTLLAQVNRTLWTSSTDERGANLFFATTTCPGQSAGRLRCASAGDAGAYRLSDDGCRALLSPTSALGLAPDARYTAHDVCLDAGEALLVVSEGVRTLIEAESHLFGDEPLAQSLVEHLGAPSATLADLVRDRLEALAGDAGQHDRTVLVVKRRDG